MVLAAGPLRMAVCRVRCEMELQNRYHVRNGHHVLYPSGRGERNRSVGQAASLERPMLVGEEAGILDP